MLRHTHVPAFLALLLACALTASARQLDWEEAPQYEATVNGKVDISTKVYQPTASAPYLILMAKQFKQPLLIDLGTKSVLEITMKDLAVVSEYMYSTPDVPKGRKVAGYAVKQGVTSFTVNGAAVAIRIKESLVGEVSEGIILAHSPVYGMLRDAYKPAKQEIAFLRSYTRKTSIVVMFASWCPTCRRVLPHLLRILKDAGNANFSVKYIGIAMGGNEPHEELEKYGHDYPSIILFQNGKELKRIIGDPPAPIEKVMAGILKGK